MRAADKDARFISSMWVVKATGRSPWSGEGATSAAETQQEGVMGRKSSRWRTRTREAEVLRERGDGRGFRSVIERPGRGRVERKDSIWQVGPETSAVGRRRTDRRPRRGGCRRRLVGAWEGEVLRVGHSLTEGEGRNSPGNAVRVDAMCS